MHPAKETIVEDLQAKLNASPFLFVADYTGLKVHQFAELRNRLWNVGARCHVVKNTFLRRAAKSAGLPELGGLKGRILPALKLDPLGSEAQAGARYPVTEAGLAGMIRQMIVHRENDLNHGHGVICSRLANQTFDERECYCFRYEYSAPEFNTLYRKSIVLMDTRYHVPLQVTNYTWSDNAEGMTQEQLDEMTMIEDYAFRQLDMGAKLVAEDFSRDNPAYRM